LTPARYVVDGVPEALRVGDLDCDRRPDVVVAVGYGDAVYVLRNRGDGTLQQPISYSVAGGPDGLAIADFDRNGTPDLAVAQANGGVQLFRGDCKGGLHLGPDYQAQQSVESLDTPDLNGDGRPDIVAAPWILPDISALLNTSPRP